MPQPKIVDALMALLEAETAATTTNQEVPTAAAVAAQPLVRITSLGGNGDRFDSRPTVDIESFGSRYATARDLADEVHDLMVAYPLRIAFGVGQVVVIDEVTVESEPFKAPWDDSRVTRFLATYRLVARR